MLDIKNISKQEAVQKFDRYVSSGKVEFYQQAGIEFLIGRRDGVRVWDLDGRELINCHSNGGVFNLGHRNPRIIGALQDGLQSVDIGNHHLISPKRAELGERLAASCPGDLNRVVFGVSGGEAIDMAIKIARGATGRAQIISAEGGYHGHTGFALAAGDPEYSDPFRHLAEGFTKVPFGDLFALEETAGDQTAAVLLETIPATAGIVIPPEGYYEGVRKVCDRHGIVMIMDEVQTGLGRCGERWGIETFGVTPDIIVTGKGLSGGIYPLTATIYHEALNTFLHENPFIHISTFGGSELGCYTALEVLAMLDEPGFMENVRDRANDFREGFQELKERHPAVVVEARQLGLMMGLKMANEMCGPLMSRLGFDEGLLAVYANNDKSVLQVLPPLIISQDEVPMVIDRLDRMLARLEFLLGGPGEN